MWEPSVVPRRAAASEAAGHHHWLPAMRLCICTLHLTTDTTVNLTQ